MKRKQAGIPPQFILGRFFAGEIRGSSATVSRFGAKDIDRLVSLLLTMSHVFDRHLPANPMFVCVEPKTANAASTYKPGGTGNSGAVSSGGSGGTNRQSISRRDKPVSKHEEETVLRKMTILLAGLLAVLTFSVVAAQAKTFYWVSHGSPADPVWTYFLAGAKQWATDTGHTVNTSFHSGDVPAHQEAVRAAIAAKADGIVTTSPDPGSLVKVVEEARAANIPIINFNTSDPTAKFNAYVGGDLVAYGKAWAQYLVDKKLVKEGDFVWMPVEVPGATYGVQEEQGIASVFKPLNIAWEVTDSTLDQAEVINRMSDYLTANRSKIKAIIGLGDLVTGSIKRVFDQVGVKAGEIPVVGWGNSIDTTQEVLNGYVNAAQWQDPQATSYMALSLANMAASGIPPGFNIITGALYEKDTAAVYDKILSSK
jgi:simple sugar transport system substrate-binding protein